GGTMDAVKTAAAWKAAAMAEAAEEAKPLTLPSGVEILARRPGPAMLAAHCKLPMGLANAVRGDEQRSETDTATVFEMMAFTRDILMECVVSPRIVEKPGPGELR